MSVATLIGWLIASSYVAAALVFARSTLRRWQADPGSETACAEGGVDRAMSALMALLAGVFWPLTIAFFALRDWLWKPADSDRARWMQMEHDRDDWRRKAGTAASEEERATAAGIADALDDLLRNKTRTR